MKADCFHCLFTSVVVSSGDGVMVVFLWCFVVVMFLCGSAIALFFFCCGVFVSVFLFWWWWCLHCHLGLPTLHCGDVFGLR